MLDPIDLIRLSSSAKELLSNARGSEESKDVGPSLHGLDLLVVFSGYLDAGNVSTQLDNVLLERLVLQRIVTFVTDHLLDYRARRPPFRFAGYMFFVYATSDSEYHILT